MKQKKSLKTQHSERYNRVLVIIIRFLKQKIRKEDGELMHQIGG
jgi:hypothetical protein